MKAWQVDVTNVTATSSATMAWRSGGQLRVTVIVKSVFAFAPNETMQLIDADPILDADQYDEEHVTRSVRAPSDRFPFRPRVDVVFWGHAYAPGGAPAKRVPARIAIAEGNEKTLDKVIDVVGDRHAPNADPAPFTKMPINYERSYGGAGFEANPIGVGFGPRALAQPNIVYPQGWHRETIPASFGPIAAAWPGRVRLAGTQPLDFLGKTVSELLPHVDVANFQCAPEDQRIAHLHGGEWILLENLHPLHARLMMRLPDVQGVGMVFGADGVDTPIAMRADMLFIDGDREVCILTCRGSHPIPNEAALDDLRIAAGVELNRRPIDWTEAKQKSTLPVTGEPGTALLDAHSPIQFKTPYAIAEPRKAAAAVVASAGAAALLPGAPFAPVAFGSIPAPPPGAATFVATAAQSSGQLPSLPFAHGTSSPPAIPGAPFASVGAPAASPPALPSPVGESTIALSGPPNVPPNFHELRGLTPRGSSSPAAFHAKASPNDALVGQPGGMTPPAAHHAKATPTSSGLGPGTPAIPGAPFASAGAPAASPLAVPSPVGNSTIALSGPLELHDLHGQTARGSSSPAAFHAKASPNDALVGQTGGMTPPAAHHAKATPTSSGLGPGANAQLIAAPYDMSQRPLEKETFVPPDRQYAPYVAMGAPDAQNAVRPMGDSSAVPSLPHEPGANMRNPASSSAMGASPSVPMAADAINLALVALPVGSAAIHSGSGTPGTGSDQQLTAYGKPAVSDDSDLGSSVGTALSASSRQHTGFITTAVSGESELRSSVGTALSASSRQHTGFITTAVSGESELRSSVGTALTASSREHSAFITTGVSDDSDLDSALGYLPTEPELHLTGFGKPAVADDSELGSNLPSNETKEWSWAKPATVDLSSQQNSASPSRPAARPAEPSPRALIYSGFARRR